MTLDCEVVVTNTGAHAIRDRITGELMHPVVGPIVEAEQLYVRASRLAARLKSHDDEPLVLLDVGLGAASNAIAAWRVSESLPLQSRRLSIVSFDRSLDALELALRPEHTSRFGLEGDAGVAARALLRQGQSDTERTSWRLVHGDLLETLAAQPAASSDMVYWDLFSQRTHPDLWTMATFKSLRRTCRSGATVHTYSGATSVRSAMLLAGFAVGIGNDVGESKQNTCAAVNVEDLECPLNRRFIERLSRSSLPFPVDAPADAFAQISALPQFQIG